MNDDAYKSPNRIVCVANIVCRDPDLKIGFKMHVPSEFMSHTYTSDRFFEGPFLGAYYRAEDFSR